MPETELILLILAVCLLLLAVLQTGRILTRLGRIEARLAQVSMPAEPAGEEAAGSETSPGGMFESFLAEDPTRRTMTKSEQFAAFRKWRREKGLNWSKS